MGGSSPNTLAEQPRTFAQEDVYSRTSPGTDGLLVQLKVTPVFGQSVTKHAPELEPLSWV